MIPAGSADLLRRQAAVESVLQRFGDVAFAWADASCIHLAREQGVAMGHDLPEVPLFKSAQGARRALAEFDVDSVSALLDLWFERLEAPVCALPGDLLTLPGQTELGLRDDKLAGVGIADGCGNVYGWHASNPDRLSEVKFAAAQFTGAWRL